MPQFTATNRAVNSEDAYVDSFHRRLCILCKVRMKSVPKLAPGLKEWIDNVIVPALVREFVAEMQEQNKLALADNSPLLSVTEPKILASTRELQ
jgi:phosphopantothenoylcysteine synthetase/decarboxylase